MPDPPSPTRAQIPSALAASKPTQPDTFHPVPAGSSASPSAIPAKQDGPSHHDYTENAPQAVVDAIAIEREREAKEAPPDMMVGSFQSWAGVDGGELLIAAARVRRIRLMIDQGIYPSSITRTPLRPGSRRASIVSMSRRSGSFGPRASTSMARPSASQLDLNAGMQSPSSGVFDVDSEDEVPGPSRYGPYSPAARRRESKRRSRADSRAQQQGYFGYRPEHESPAGSPENLISPIATSPHRHSTTFGRIASYIGFARDEEEGHHSRRPSFSRERSRDRSYASSRGDGTSSETSEEDWGYNDDDSDASSSHRASGEEGYTSSLADDTSLPPNSRPGSPHLPLIPTSSDAVFGERARDLDDEPKDFDSTSVPSRQTILLPDEDLSIRFTGYRTDPIRNVLWWIGCILTLGGLGLIGRWIPSTWVKFVGKETAFEDAKEGSWLVVEVNSISQIWIWLTGRLPTATSTSSHCKLSLILTLCPPCSRNSSHNKQPNLLAPPRCEVPSRPRMARQCSRLYTPSMAHPAVSERPRISLKTWSGVRRHGRRRQASSRSWSIGTLALPSSPEQVAGR